MIISTDVKKKSEKVKNIFMIKNLSRLGKKQTLQSDKGHVKKKNHHLQLTSHSMNNERFPAGIRNKAERLMLFVFNTVLVAMAAQQQRQAYGLMRKPKCLYLHVWTL